MTRPTLIPWTTFTQEQIRAIRREAREAGTTPRCQYKPLCQNAGSSLGLARSRKPGSWRYLRELWNVQNSLFVYDGRANIFSLAF